jgi:hypothetical protein
MSTCKTSKFLMLFLFLYLRMNRVPRSKRGLFSRQHLSYFLSSHLLLGVPMINATIKTLSSKGAGDYNLPACLQLCLLGSVSSWTDWGGVAAVWSKGCKCTVRRHLICLCKYIMLPWRFLAPFCTYSMLLLLFRYVQAREKRSSTAENAQWTPKRIR